MGAAGAAAFRVLFEIMRNPAFLFAPRRKNAAGDRVADNDVPVTPEPHLANGVMDRFMIIECDRHERRSGVPARAFPDGGKDALSKIAGDLRVKEPSEP